MKTKRLLIQNGPIVTPHRIIPNGGVLIENGKITEILDKPINPCDISEGADIEIFDAKGATISPGFVDIHVHGGGGKEVMGASPSEIGEIASAHGKYGTTSILPTTLAAPIPDILHTMESIELAMNNAQGGANILGTHLEGPFFAQSQRGAQAAEHIILPTKENIEQLLSNRNIKIMGAAPEIPGGMELGLSLASRGITASIAHSDATFEDVERAMEYGYTDITHIYSGCSNVHRVNAYRVAGVVEAGLYFDSLTTQVIADGKHLPPSLLRLIYKCKGPDKIALITDGLGPSAWEMPEGTIYTQKNGVEIILHDGVMKLMDKQAFAGSCATMLKCMQNMVNLAGVPLVDAVKMASTTPAKLVGATKKGQIAPAYDADIILLDSQLNIHKVMTMGKWT